MCNANLTVLFNHKMNVSLILNILLDTLKGNVWVVV